MLIIYCLIVAIWIIIVIVIFASSAAGGEWGCSSCSCDAMFCKSCSSCVYYSYTQCTTQFNVMRPPPPAGDINRPPVASPVPTTSSSAGGSCQPNMPALSEIKRSGYTCWNLDLICFSGDMERAAISAGKNDGCQFTSEIVLAQIFHANALFYLLFISFLWLGASIKCVSALTYP